MRSHDRLAWLTSFALSAAASAGPGRIIAIGDEWLLSDRAFADNPTQTTQLAANISRFFTDDSPSRMLVLSNAFPVLTLGQRGVLGVSLKTFMESKGHIWEVNPTITFNVATLRNYRAVFLAGAPGNGTANAAALTAYANQGGNVLIMGGTGNGNEYSGWDAFLNAFGLEMGNSFFAYSNGDDPLLTVAALPSTNPLGASITSVKWGNGQTVTDLEPDNPLNEVALYGNFVGPMINPPSTPVQPIIGTVNISSICLGDLNQDRVVDDADFLIFAAAYDALLCSDPTMPAGCPSDFDKNGIVDDMDFQLFVVSYDLATCP